MRVLIAPDKFAGTLSAVEAAEAIAEGWRREAPDDVLDLVPMADGGPGFVDVLHTSLGGELLAVAVRGPYGDEVPGSVLLADGTAYVESAQACGLHLTAEADRQPERAGTYGVGELVRAAVEAGATRVVVGLGGSGTNDGGAGLLAGLGATSQPDGALTGNREYRIRFGEFAPGELDGLIEAGERSLKRDGPIRGKSVFKELRH